MVFLSVKLQRGSKLGEKEVAAKVAVCNPLKSIFLISVNCFELDMYTRNAIQEIQDAIDSTGMNGLVKYLNPNQEDLDEHSA